MAKVNKTCHPAKRRGELLERDAPARQKKMHKKIISRQDRGSHPQKQTKVREQFYGIRQDH